MSKKRIPEEIQEAILNDLELTTLSVPELAADFRVDVSTIYRIGKEAGVDMKKRGRALQVLRKAVSLYEKADLANSEAMHLLEEARA